MGRTSARRWPSTILAVFAVLAGLEGRAAAEPPSSAQRRCLVELDRAVIARGHLLAAVEQGGREIGGEAADGDHLIAAIDALRG